jgi:uroporphyrinogen decarboxylase
MPVMERQAKEIVRAWKGEKTKPVWWLMRQAGRYLPEYRELRAQAGGFLNMVYNPELASEVTMQPLRRFGMDAAILFSDILVIPQALGQPLRFETGEGPALDALVCADDIKKLNIDRIDLTLAPVYDTVSSVAAKLKTEGFTDTALIGFAGASWTIACYMIEGRGSRDFAAAKAWAAHDPKSFMELINVISGATLHYLSKQVEAGAEALQLFDSWAGVADEAMFDQWIIEPTRALVAALKKRHPDVPIIGFPRGAGEKSRAYFEKTGVDCIGVDYAMSASWAQQNLQSIGCVQGNMDPVYLLNGGAEMDRAATHVLSTFSGGPFVFNLGHGVIKETDPDDVARLGKLIKEFR